MLAMISFEEHFFSSSRAFFRIIFLQRMSAQRLMSFFFVSFFSRHPPRSIELDRIELTRTGVLTASSAERVRLVVTLTKAGGTLRCKTVSFAVAYSSAWTAKIKRTHLESRGSNEDKKKR
jgi:hypothetical protein